MSDATNIRAHHMINEHEKLRTLRRVIGNLEKLSDELASNAGFRAVVELPTN